MSSSWLGMIIWVNYFIVLYKLTVVMSCHITSLSSQLGGIVRN